MLAQNFKSPTDLGLTDAEQSAFILVLGLLERGELVHVTKWSGASLRKDGQYSGQFCMELWNDTFSSCGTIGCIGGTAEMVGNLPHGSLLDTMKGNQKLTDLCFPGELLFEAGVEIDYSDITPAQAARALRSYLTTGDPNWVYAVA